MTEVPTDTADSRNNLESAAVTALADQLHGLLCMHVSGPQPIWSGNHRALDRDRARFLLIGLRESGWELRR